MSKRSATKHSTIIILKYNVAINFCRTTSDYCIIKNFVDDAAAEAAATATLHYFDVKFSVKRNVNSEAIRLSNHSAEVRHII